MKLPEAIEIASLLHKEGGSALHPDTLDALKLLIEAGKAQETYRRLGFIRPDQLLPGETKE